MTYSSIKELQEALEALPLLRPSVDGLDPNKTVVACHAEHLEEAIEFYKKNLKSLPAFYILGDYSNIKADKNISLNDFAKLDNTFSVHAFTAQAKDPMFVKFRPLTMALQEQGIIKFSVERYSTENFALRNNTREFTPNYWESILNFTNLLKDNESKCAYMGAIKASILGEPEYIPIANYKQYYHPKLLPAPQDIICEGGIDNGKTTLEFFDFMQNKGKIYAFEAYKPTWENLRRKFAPFKGNIILEEQALWENTGKVPIADTINSSCVNVNLDENLTPCVSIDDYFKDKVAPTFIKLDVEGAEYSTLKGAENTIKQHSPKLAISIYHLFMGFDLVKVPELLMSMNLDYDFYCGHHGPWYWETILYAKKKGN